MILNKTLKTEVSTIEKLVDDCYQLFHPSIPLYKRTVNIEVADYEEYKAVQTVLKSIIDEQIQAIKSSNTILGVQEMADQYRDVMTFTNFFVPQIGYIKVGNGDKRIYR